jgi:hypothetical protein
LQANRARTSRLAAADDVIPVVGILSIVVGLYTLLG